MNDIAHISITLNDEEGSLVLEALYEAVQLKEQALKVVNDDLTARGCTARQFSGVDFGIPQIRALIARLEG